MQSNLMATDSHVAWLKGLIDHVTNLLVPASFFPYHILKQTFGHNLDVLIFSFKAMSSRSSQIYFRYYWQIVRKTRLFFHPRLLVHQPRLLFQLSMEFSSVLHHKTYSLCMYYAICFGYDFPDIYNLDILR